MNNGLKSLAVAALLALMGAAPAFAAVSLMSTASGNIDSTGTWSVIDTTGTNAYLNSETANTALTTSGVASSTFTPAAETLTAIGVKLASVAASPSGTLTIKLANSTSPGNRECTLTVNVADLAAVNGAPAAATADGGWVVLACAASPNGTDAYTITANTSVAAQVNLFSLLTTNWSRLLVTNGTQTGGPAAGDKIFVYGKLTAAGTHSAFTVTVETTANTNYGNVANTLIDPSISVGQFGTLAFANVASTAYLMEFAGPMVVYNGGTFTEGTSASPIPASGSATLTLNSTVEGDTGINVRNGGSLSIAGSSGGRNVVKTRATAQATAATTSTLTTEDVTGWLAGDQVYYAGTVLTTTLAGYKGEAATLGSNASGNSVPLSAAVTNTHTAQHLSYTSTQTGVPYDFKMYPDVALLNRNAIVQGSGSTTNGYLYFQANSIAAITWTEFSQISGLVAGQRGLEVDTGPLGSFSITNFSIINSHNDTMVLAPTNTMFGGTSSSYLLIQHGVFYNDGNNTAPTGGVTTYVLGIIAVTRNPFWKIDDIVTLYCANGSFHNDDYYLSVAGGQFSNISSSGSGTGGTFVLTFLPPYDSENVIGGSVGNTFGPITTYANIGGVVNATGYQMSGLISGFYLWHEGGRFILSGSDLTIDPFYLITSAFGMYNPLPGNVTTLRNGVIGFDANTTAMIAAQWDSTPGSLYLDNMELCPNGTVGGITFVACLRGISLVSDLNSSGDYVASVAQVYLRNSSNLNTVDYPSVQGQESFYSRFASVIQDCAACSPTTHAAWIRGGFLSYDTAIFHSSGFSLRMTPRVWTVSGYISSGSGSTTPGKTLTVTNNPFSAVGGSSDILTSDSGSFLPGTRIISGVNPSFTVSLTQSVGSAASPAKFQSYLNYGSLIRLQSAPAENGVKVAVASGKAASVCVWVRPSISTDAAPSWGSAATYNADAPRIIVRANPYMGVQSDTVIATSSLTAGTWGQVCGTTPTAPADGQFEVVVDADETFSSNVGGWINVAEWSCSNCSTANGSQFWWNGLPSTTLAPKSGGGHIIGGFLLRRDIDPASNDNSPPFLRKAG